MYQSAPSLGETIRDRRKRLGIKTQKALADKAQVQRERVNQIENDKFTGRITDLERVLAVLGMELSARVIDKPTLDNIASMFADDDDDNEGLGQ